MVRERRPLVFLGTPLAAVTVLRALIESGFEVVHVVTRPDARRGRGTATTPSPVKEAAIALGLPVSHDLTWIENHLDDGLLGVVVAYGRIIPSAVLARIPMINVHFSLLPRWRGAAPVERAIMAGDSETGVCIMDVDPTLDTGAVHARASLSIRHDHTTESLTSELAEAGALLLVRTLESGLEMGEPQSGEITYADKIGPADMRIDWMAPAETIGRTVRAVRAYTLIDGRRLRIIKVETGVTRAGAPGEFDDDALVATGDGALRLVAVQPEGRQTMDAMSWLRGRGPGAARRFE